MCVRGTTFAFLVPAAIACSPLSPASPTQSRNVSRASFEYSKFLFFSHQLHVATVKQEIRGQAAAIVGSVDFLGNPMGLYNDVTSGLEGLVKKGNVGGLFLNVAHGVSDSAAKVRTQRSFS